MSQLKLTENTFFKDKCLPVFPNQAVLLERERISRESVLHFHSVYFAGSRSGLSVVPDCMPVQLPQAVMD